MQDVGGYYDDYVERQVRVGINARHRAIAAAVHEAGWLPSHRVLEIGAGVGTLTELLADGLDSSGFLLATDLSPRSIDVARSRLPTRPNIELVAGDILELDISGPFDVIVLPDVIEHIPLELHDRLFERVAGWLGEDGFVMLNYPNPNYLAWCHEHTPEVLQVIDQPIHADVLLSHVYRHGMYLDRLETYSLWVREGDYVRAVLRRRDAASNFTRLEAARPSRVSRAGTRLRRLIRG